MFYYDVAQHVFQANNLCTPAGTLKKKTNMLFGTRLMLNLKLQITVLSFVTNYEL